MSVWVCFDEGKPFRCLSDTKECNLIDKNGLCFSGHTCDAVEYVPVKMGKWEKQIGPYHKCSVCWSSIDSNEVYIATYCFGCGAKMMEEKG